MQFDADRLIGDAFRAILGREIDASGLAHFRSAFAQGATPQDFLAALLGSEEYRGRALGTALPKIELPDLATQFPDEYWRGPDGVNHLLVRGINGPEDYNRFERLIIDHHYYDGFNGTYYPTLDTSKKVTAAMMIGLQPKRSLELGCFNGIVVGLLNQAGVDARGIDPSHLAFALADPAVRGKIMFGDLLRLPVEGSFDVIAGMDIYEHLNPVKLGDYLRKTASILSPDGFVIMCSPMFGEDRIFGNVCPKYLPEWEGDGEDDEWTHITCDDRGWPFLGHLIFQNTRWWEKQCRLAGLVRDTEIEVFIHSKLEDFYKVAPYRKGMFVLKKPEGRKSLKDVQETLVREIDGALL